MPARIEIKSLSGQNVIKVIEQQPGDPAPKPKIHVLQPGERTQINTATGTSITVSEAELARSTE